MKWSLKVAFLAALMTIGAAQVTHAQRQDRYVYEKLQEQEKHLDNTDANVKDNAKDIMTLREQIESYKDYALGFSGCLTLFVAALKFLGRKEEQSA
jgi:peptidoglycan hydrolase CwlO-like protein